MTKPQPPGEDSDSADSQVSESVPAKQPRSKVMLLGGTVLVSEVIVLYFAALTGWGLRPVPFVWLALGLGVIVALCVAAVVLLPRYRFERRPGIALGWVVQVAILAGGIVMPALIIVGVVFGAMWAVALYWGRRIDREAQEWGR